MAADVHMGDPNLPPWWPPYTLEDEQYLALLLENRLLRLCRHRPAPLSPDQFAALVLTPQRRLKHVITLPARLYLFRGAEAWAWHLAHHLTQSMAIVTTFYCEITCVSVRTRSDGLGSECLYEVTTHVYS
jgi:hypothetical protein